MKSVVNLKIEVTVEPGTYVYRFNEKASLIERLLVMETYIKKSPWKDEHGIPYYKTSLSPSYIEYVVCESGYSNDPISLPLESVWSTPEEAMESYAHKKLNEIKKKLNKN